VNTTRSSRVVAALLGGALTVALHAGFTPQAFGAEASSGANLAVAARASSSFVSGDTSVGALNDARTQNSSRDRRNGAYGNWPSRGKQWVQYEWDRPVTTKKIDVYWWDDNRGVRLPKACRLLTWDGKQFVPVAKAAGLGVAADRFNTTTFTEVTTTKLRLEIESAAQNSTGILEWRVYNSGRFPAFPPVVTAGVDRVVVRGGKTYLGGSVKVVGHKDGTIKTAWSKASGPGKVTFANASAPVTTATFSAPGVYVLKLAAGVGELTGVSTLAVKVISPPPAKELGLVDTRPYRIDSPLWNARAKALIINWIPHCIRKIEDPNLPQGGLNNFIDAANKLAGKPHGRHRGYVFSNAWIHNTVESICLALMVDPRGDAEIITAQKAMRVTLEKWIPIILAAQEPDGYMQTVFTLSDREHWSPKHRNDHEGYVAGYFLESAIGHYSLTKGADKRLYNAAKKLADCWVKNIGPAPKKPWFDGHQAMEIALVRFGRFVNRIDGEGKGDKYVTLAKFLLDSRAGGHSYDQSHVPAVQQYEAVGHAVRAVYSYAGMADVAMETGDVDYHSAVASLWDNIVNRKYYVTGGVGSGETSEGFGPDYSLRHNAYCESCSSCGEIFFQHKLNLTYHHAKYADLYEETLYNALLGSMDLEGKNFYYQNPLTSGRNRYDWHGCPCCVGNIPRTLLMLPTWMYARDDGGIYVNLFIGSTVTVEDVAGMDVEMIQATKYPFGDKVAITINPAKTKKFSVRIRLPNRAVSELYTATPRSDGITRIEVNGKTVTPPTVNGYAVITRTWKTGDRIDLVLPMKIQRIKGSDKIAATAGQVALRYGPLIYTAENVDQSLGSSLKANSLLKPQWRGDLLGGVTVINGTWADGKALMAIPYYARNNRQVPNPNGTGTRPASSSVWVKDE